MVCRNESVLRVTALPRLATMRNDRDTRIYTLLDGRKLRADQWLVEAVKNSIPSTKKPPGAHGSTKFADLVTMPGCTTKTSISTEFALTTNLEDTLVRVTKHTKLILSGKFVGQ